MTPLSGSFSENYQTELGLRALIWRKNWCEYASHGNEEFGASAAMPPGHTNLTLGAGITANLTIINDGRDGDH